MRKIEVLLKQKMVDSQNKYETSIDATKALRSLVNGVRNLAQSSVDKANTKNEATEKLVCINEGIISIVQLCETAAIDVVEAGVKYKAELQLLTELLQNIQTSENEEQKSPPAEENESSNTEIADEKSPEDN